MQTQQIPFSKLRLSPANARKSFSQAGVEALAISIDAYGLLQPVIVSPAPDKKSLFYVHAGGRRWRAIAKLIESGELPKNATRSEARSVGKECVSSVRFCVLPIHKQNKK